MSLRSFARGTNNPGDAALFDAKIERDAENGTLDRVFATSEEDFRAGRLDGLKSNQRISLSYSAW